MSSRKITVKGLEFKGRGQHGDFRFMLKDSAYVRYIFFMADNVQSSLDKDDYPGAGTASLRPYLAVHMVNPRAFNIPTGWSVLTNGFDKLGPEEQAIIDLHFEQALLVIYENKQIDTLVFPCDPNNDYLIGNGVFEFAIEVRTYISAKIWAISTIDFDSPPITKSHTELHNEMKLYETYMKTLMQAAKERQKREFLASASSKRARGRTGTLG
tara:strand:+ start:11511 stop:12146 length:636 start_codon:yes stop_codon:yes gene_type:complete